MRRVRFLRPVPPYLAGEEAGFDEPEAARLIARGLAVACAAVAQARPGVSPEGAGHRAYLEKPRPARDQPPRGRGRRRKGRGRGGRA
jgi:hypothetical protein